MKSIAVFNNKGGVGKTTLLCNLAAFLAVKHNKQVLVIDADPQCNTTQSIFDDETIYNLYTKGEFTISTVVEPLSQGRGFLKDVEPKSSESFGVDVIPGDPRLSLTEDLLSGDWIQASAGDTRGLRTTFLFSYLLSQCSGYDYVFFDMGPSLGSINRAVLIAADYFIMPMALDIFSLRALENIGSTVTKWRTRLEQGLGNNDSLDALEIDEPRWKLKFAGYVVQQYTARRDNSGQPRAVKAYDKILKQVPKAVEKEIISKFGSEGSNAADYELGTIPALHSLVPLSQTSRKPIFGLKAGDGVVGAHFTKVREFEEVIEGIAQRLEENLGDEE